MVGAPVVGGVEMVVRTAGPFDYYAVTGDSIRASAEAPATNAGVIQTLAGDLETDEKKIVAAVEGDITTGLVANPRAASATAQTLAANGLYAVALIKLFGDDVNHFDDTVNQINVDYHSMVNTAVFKEQHDPDVKAGTGKIDRPLIGSSIKAQLVPRYRAAEGTLDDRAAAIATDFTQGPTDANVRDLVRAGLIPLTAASLWPTLVLTSDDKRKALDAEVAAMVVRMIAAGTLPAEVDGLSAPEFRQYLIDHPDLATTLMDHKPFMGGEWPESALAGLIGTFMTAPGGAGEVMEQRRQDARALFESLGPDSASMLAMLFPGTVGNLSGVPFVNRADANTVAVIAALDSEHGNLADLKTRHEHNQHDWDFLGRNNNDLEGPIGDSEDRIKLYESILANDRQIIVFDPANDGAIAELHGPISATTKNVGVFVPGTGSDMSNFQGTADRSTSFVEGSRPGELSMISWLGGDMPDGIIKDAPFANYSRDLGPLLANFSHDVRQEIDHSPGAGHNIQTTYAGHSYGGAVVGRSELAGLDADRVLHIESAGMGHDVKSPGDLPKSQTGVDRYSMTAPGDIIGDTQGVQFGDNMGHGADPDTFEDTMRLDTGNKAGSDEPNIGADSHGAVLERNSDAWKNIRQVLTGGVVTTYREPEYYVPPTPYAVPIQTGWATPVEKVDIP